MRSVILSLLCWNLTLAAWAQSGPSAYSIAKIADNRPASPYAAFRLLGHALNGDILFGARTKAGISELYIARGTSLTKIIDDTGELLTVGFAALNSSGGVVLSAQLDDGTQGVYRVRDGKLIPLYSSRTDGYGIFIRPAINEAGAVCYTVQPMPFGALGTGTKVYFSSADTPVVIADQTANLQGNSSSQCDLNGRNQVAFIASSLFGGGALIRWDGGQFQNVVGNNQGFQGATEGPSINNTGDIGYRFFDLSIGFRLRLARPGTVVPIDLALETSTPLAGSFKYADYLQLNNQGSAAFFASGHAGAPAAGFYTSANGITTRRIAVGDAAFGSTLKGFSAPQHRYLDDAGRISIHYSLDNGEEGIAVTSGPPAPPAIAPNGLLNAASYALAGQPGHAVSPGALVVIYGTNLSSGTYFPTSAVAPEALGDTSVSIGGIAARLVAATPTAVYALVPYNLTGSDAIVRVRTQVGESGPITIQLTPTSPAIYTFNQQGSGQGIVVLANTASLAAPAGATAGSRPARAGETLTVYATGLGAVSPSIGPGVNSCDPSGVCNPDYSNVVLRRAINTPTIEIGGAAIPPSNITFAGLAPTFVGLYQINFALPTNTVKGAAVPIVVRQGNTSSRSGVTIAIE
jgi:uncharacterized protein (TIGR03437 family)